MIWHKKSPPTIYKIEVGLGFYFLFFLFGFTFFLTHRPLDPLLLGLLRMAPSAILLITATRSIPTLENIHLAKAVSEHAHLVVALDMIGLGEHLTIPVRHRLTQPRLGLLGRRWSLLYTLLHNRLLNLLPHFYRLGGRSRLCDGGCLGDRLGCRLGGWRSNYLGLRDKGSESRSDLGLRDKGINLGALL